MRRMVAARHPEQVRTLVAHEPPIFELLADRDYWRSVIEGVGDAFRTDALGYLFPDACVVRQEQRGGRRARRYRRADRALCVAAVHHGKSGHFWWKKMAINCKNSV